jgi:hypothetical protein
LHVSIPVRPIVPKLGPPLTERLSFRNAPRMGGLRHASFRPVATTIRRKIRYSRDRTMRASVIESLMVLCNVGDSLISAPRSRIAGTMEAATNRAPFIGWAGDFVSFRKQAALRLGTGDQICTHITIGRSTAKALEHT